MSGERTEAATPRRLQQLRSEGRVIRSTDLNSAVALLAGFAILQQFGGDGVGRLRAFMQTQLEQMARTDLTASGASGLGYVAWEAFLGTMAPLLLLLPLAALAVNLVQVGLLLSGKALAPDFNRVNPLTGLQRMFSSHSLVEFAKTVAKLVILGFILSRTYVDMLPKFMALATSDLRASAQLLGETSLQLAMAGALVVLVIGIFDYGYQRWEFQRSARMSKEEIKEEFRQTESSPQMRARIRRRQREMATRRMMQDVPKADVIVTNPTHLAVALAYRGGDMAAPKVLAKGADKVAERIKEIARQHRVPVVENKPLAQALYRSVEIGREIPAELFQAVAEVLAYIYTLRARRAMRTPEMSNGAGA